MKILVSIAATLLSTSICSVAIAQESTKGDVEEALILLEAKGDAVCVPTAAIGLVNGEMKEAPDYIREAKPERHYFRQRISSDQMTMVNIIGQSTIFFSERAKVTRGDEYTYNSVNLEDQKYIRSVVLIPKNGQAHSLAQVEYSCLFLDD